MEEIRLVTPTMFKGFSGSQTMLLVQVESEEYVASLQKYLAGGIPARPLCSNTFGKVRFPFQPNDIFLRIYFNRLEICKQAQRDNSAIGIAYKEMAHNILSPIVSKQDTIISRFDVHHALPRITNASVFIGRAAHIAVLDSELFIEKFLLVAGLKYFT